MGRVACGGKGLTDRSVKTKTRIIYVLRVLSTLKS